MKNSKPISDSFAELVAHGTKVLKDYGWGGKTFQTNPPPESYVQFRTSAMNLVRRVCGETSDHLATMRLLDAGGLDSWHYPHCLGALKAAQHDFEAGLLFDVHALIEAEVLGDFIEQAEALLRAGYYVPAASLAGAVLEDTLRKLCVKHKLPVAAETKISVLNADLARAGVYDKLVNKRVTGLADVRNNADHGHPDKFSKEDVEDMLKYVSRFTADYLS